MSTSKQKLLDLAMAKKRRYTKIGRSKKAEEKLKKQNGFCSRMKESPDVYANRMSNKRLEQFLNASQHEDSCEGYCYSPIYHNLHIGDTVSAPIQFGTEEIKMLEGKVIGIYKTFVRIDFGAFKESFTYVNN